MVREPATGHIRARRTPQWRGPQCAPALWDARSLHVRVKRLVSRCKHSPHAIPNRYTFVSAPELPFFTNHQSRIMNHTLPTGVLKTLCVLGWSPGTVNRVEARVNRRKHTVGTPLTRNVPVHPNSPFFSPLQVEKGAAAVARRRRKLSIQPAALVAYGASESNAFPPIDGTQRQETRGREGSVR